MVDGSEVIRVSFADGGTDAVTLYPKEVVMTAALDVLDALDASGEDEELAPDSGVTFFDLSRGRIET